MQLSKIENEDALDLLADILEPMSTILADPKLKEVKNGKMVNVAAYILKNHKEAVMQVLARLDGVPVEEYHCNVFTVPSKILKLLNDPEFKELFT